MVKFGAEQADRAQPGRAASLGGGVHDVHQRIFAYNLQRLTVISLWSGWLVVFAALLWRPPIPEARRPALDLSSG
jgi:hypothetical protein